MKTQQTSLMMTLLGAHGGEVLFVVVVVLQPITVQLFAIIIGTFASTFLIDTDLAVDPTVYVIDAFNIAMSFAESALSYIFASSIFPLNTAFVRERSPVAP